MRFEELPEFLYGRDREDRAQQFMLQRGVFLVPTRDLKVDDKAPRMYGVHEGKRTFLVLPDFDCCRDGKRWWTEVKGKAVPWFPLIDKQFVHGVDHRLFVHYHCVREISGCDVYLLIVEGCTGQVLSAKLPNEPDDVLASTRCRGKKMANFFRSRFQRIGQTQTDGDACAFRCRPKPYGGAVVIDGARLDLERVRETLDPAAVCPLLRGQVGDAIDHGAWSPQGGRQASFASVLADA